MTHDDYISASEINSVAQTMKSALDSTCQKYEENPTVSADKCHVLSDLESVLSNVILIERIAKESF